MFTGRYSIYIVVIIYVKKSKLTPIAMHDIDTYGLNLSPELIT